MPHEISIERVFSAGHAIALYDGSVEPVHGHDWTLTVTVAADELDRIGLVMDFHALEETVNGIIAPWQNRHLNDCPPFSEGVNPTAERVAEHVAEQVQPTLPENARLVSVSITEAPGCVATWRA